MSSSATTIAASQSAASFQAITFRRREVLDARSGAVLATLGNDDVWRGRDGTVLDGLDLPAPQFATRVGGPPCAAPDAEANAAWMRLASDAVRTVAKSKRFLTTDDPWELIEFVPIEGRQWGSVMLACRRAGIIERTEQQLPSRRPSAHRRPVQVWRSLIYDGLALFDPDAQDAGGRAS